MIINNATADKLIVFKKGRTENGGKIIISVTAGTKILVYILNILSNVFINGFIKKYLQQKIRFYQNETILLVRILIR